MSVLPLPSRDHAALAEVIASADHHLRRLKRLNASAEQWLAAAQSSPPSPPSAAVVVAPAGARGALRDG